MVSEMTLSNLLWTIIFIIAFVVFIITTYIIGKEEQDKTGLGYRTASAFLTISVSVMFASWVLRWGIKLPSDMQGFIDEWYGYTGIDRPLPATL